MQGQIDIALNKTGQQQARELAETLRHSGLAGSIDVIISSDLARARETAEVIAGVCPSAQSLVDPGLREFHAGTLEGQLITSIAGKRATIAEAWSKGDLDVPYPGGESPAEVMERGVRALRGAARLGSCIAVVAHGGLLRWCAVAIEGRSECPRELMNEPSVTGLLNARLSNCCCSTVFYDHSTDSFRAESWFDALSNGATLDDTG